MSNKYEDLIKNARMNADCGEHMSPEEVTTLLNVVEATFAALAAENAGLKEWSPNPHSASMFEAIEKAEELMDDGMPELAMIEAFEILKMKRTQATDAYLAEVRAQGADAVADQHRRKYEELKPINVFFANEHMGAQEVAEFVASQLRQDANTAELVAAGIITKVGE
ncbi:hypothetical protein ACE3J1_10250 [Enterobacter hormaechei subsp. steigerwaltii]